MEKSIRKVRFERVSQNSSVCVWFFKLGCVQAYGNQYRVEENNLKGFLLPT